MLRLVLGCLLALAAVARPALAADVLVIDRALFAQDLAEPTVEVALPDTWSRRGVPRPGLGRYRADFVLSTAPERPWALWTDRLSTDHEVRLNGVLVHAGQPEAAAARRPHPVMMVLPPSLMRTGTNTLDITIRGGVRAGLSPLRLGPVLELNEAFQRTLLQRSLVQQGINLVAAGLSLFMLLLWVLRRSEVALGSFGALGFMFSVRNAGYLVTIAPGSDRAWEWLFTCINVAGAVLLGVFAMHFSGRRPLWLRRVLMGTVLVLPPLAAWAVWTGNGPLLRAWIYPWLIGLMVPALVLLGRAAVSRRQPTEFVLLGALLVVAAVVVHDYLYNAGWLEITDEYAMPYAMPAVIAIFCVLLLNRLVRAMATAESHGQELERQVASRTAELREALQAKSRFLAAASHDLRQPVTGIGLLAALISDQARQTGAAAMVPLAGRLQQAARALENLLRRLLDISRLDSGTVRVQRRPLALDELLRTVADAHREAALRKGLQLRVSAADVMVDSDPVLLEQVLHNLAGNAVRYTSTGGVLLALRRADGGASVRVEVRDSGPGVEPAQQQAIFEEFVRGRHPVAATPASHSDGLPAPGAVPSEDAGMGLGLSIASRSARLLGTRIDLRSRPGRGSCFSFVLARSRVPPQALASLQGASATGASGRAGLEPNGPPPRWLQGRAIWLLEDDPLAREAAQLLLEHWGARVVAWASLSGFLDHLASAPEPPAAMVSDLHLRDGPGAEALARLLQRFPHTPVVAVTGSHRRAGDVLDAGLPAGTPVLLKPFAEEALWRALSSAAGQPPTAPA